MCPYTLQSDGKLHNCVFVLNESRAIASLHQWKLSSNLISFSESKIAQCLYRNHIFGVVGEIWSPLGDLSNISAFGENILQKLIDALATGCVKSRHKDSMGWDDLGKSMQAQNLAF